MSRQVKSKTAAERNFWSISRQLESLTYLGANFEVEEREPRDRFDCRSVLSAAHGRGVYVSYRVKFAGGLYKRTAVKAFAMIDGKKAPADQAIRTLWARLA